MTELRNLQVLLPARPKGEPKDGDFRFAEAPIPEPGPGEMLLRTIYLSLGPYMRLRVKSNLAEFKPGDVVAAQSGSTAYALSNGKGDSSAGRSASSMRSCRFRRRSGSWVRRASQPTRA